MNLKDLAAHPTTIRLSMALSRRMSPGLGHRLAGWAATILSALKPGAYHVLAANVGHVLGPEADERTLQQAVRHVFYMTVRGHLDLYRALNWPRQQLEALVEIPEASQAVMRSLWHQERGTVLIFPHVGNFDLGGQATASRLPEMQLLTLPDPPSGFQLSNELRRLSGVRVTPLTSGALRQAIRLLRRGGIVSTAADRPVSELDEPVLFFGRPARVPSGPVRLALKTGAAIVVTYCVLAPGGTGYVMHFEPAMAMIDTGDPVQDIQVNMRRVLDRMEAIIGRWLPQWQMYVPVWPQLGEA
jgi:phosphatidylinositol dimannoside acyltransferase